MKLSGHERRNNVITFVDGWYGWRFFSVLCSSKGFFSFPCACDEYYFLGLPVVTVVHVYKHKTTNFSCRVAATAIAQADWLFLHFLERIAQAVSFLFSGLACSDLQEIFHILVLYMDSTLGLLYKSSRLLLRYDIFFRSFKYLVVFFVSWYKVYSCLLF